MVVPTLNPRGGRHRGRVVSRTVLPLVVAVMVLVFLLNVSSYWIRGVVQVLLEEEGEGEPNDSTLPQQQQVLWMMPPYHNKKKHAPSTTRGGKDHVGDDHPSPSSTHRRLRYLIYRPPLEGAQGVGNLMNGLLAAHWLGQEFHRIVCVSTDWTDFTMAWESLTPECTAMLPLLPRRSIHNTLWILNYSTRRPVNECDLKDRLQITSPHGRDDEDDILYLVANDYPRWPSTNRGRVDWNEYYRPTAALQALWATTRTTTIAPPPITVVHLREPDNDKDHRTGLDLATRRALGERLSNHSTHQNSTTTAWSNPFLVTNQVDYYTCFQEHYGWDHPPWTGVRHSALSKVQWKSSSSSLSNSTFPQKTTKTTTTTPNDHAEEILQLWTDWWTLYQAKVIYHTHSDFSRSAARWSQCQDSYTIGGIEERSGTLILTKDRWGDEHVAPLSERSEDALLNCNGHDNSIGQAFDLDDGIHDDHDVVGGDVKKGTAG